MTLTFKDLLERLKKIDEVSLLEVLEISSEEIVDRFEDRIENKYEYLMEECGDDNQEED